MRLAGPPRLTAAALATVCVGCGGGASASAPARPEKPIVARAVPGRTCEQTVAATMRQIAARIYHQAQAGRNVASARKRLARSVALASAVAHDDPLAASTALRPLLRAQIHRIEILRGDHMLLRFGRSAALAPVHGLIVLHGRPVGRYVLAVATDASIAGVTRSVTGDAVSIERGHEPGLHVTAYPRGPLTIALARPATATTACSADGATTVVDTVGAVGKRLFRSETSSPATMRVLRHVARDRRFEEAIAHDDPAALRAAIVRFFRTPSLHVVRIRATTADGRLVNDVGGPFVLAPASRLVRAPDGRVVGRVTLSVQDDTGYIKLMHRFTGANVVLRTKDGPVPGSSHVRTGRAFSFTARAFPSGPLGITLRIPSR